MVEIIQGPAAWSAPEERGETGYVSYVLALLFTGFLDDKSRLCDLLKNDKSRYAIYQKLISFADLK